MTEKADTILSPSFIHYQRTSCTGRSTTLFLRDYVALLILFSYKICMTIVLYGQALCLVQFEDTLVFSLGLKDVERRLQQYESGFIF